MIAEIKGLVGALEVIAGRECDCDPGFGSGHQGLCPRRIAQMALNAFREAPPWETDQLAFSVINGESIDDASILASLDAAIRAPAGGKAP